MLSVAPFSVGLLINQMGASDRLLFCGELAVITRPYFDQLLSCCLRTEVWR